MIYLYSGTPGSGKSLHATKKIIQYLRLGRRVIANYPLNLTAFHLGIKERKFLYKDNTDITPDLLIAYSHKYLKPGLEGQCVLVLDECAIMFNCRDINRNDRAKWITFFQQHRKLGYNVILICQFDRMLDRQIRCFIEYEIVHRKLNSAGTVGLLLSLFGIKLFMAIEKWYGVKMLTGRETFTVSKKICNAYNSYSLFQ
ncbi:MAG: zonular occludens toxin domain-containing protein [Clostridia bacterium]